MPDPHELTKGELTRARVKRFFTRPANIALGLVFLVSAVPLAFKTKKAASQVDQHFDKIEQAEKLAIENIRKEIISGDFPETRQVKSLLDESLQINSQLDVVLDLEKFKKAVSQNKAIIEQKIADNPADKPDRLEVIQKYAPQQLDVEILKARHGSGSLTIPNQIYIRYKHACQDYYRESIVVISYEKMLEFVEREQEKLINKLTPEEVNKYKQRKDQQDFIDQYQYKTELQGLDLVY